MTPRLVGSEMCIRDRGLRACSVYARALVCLLDYQAGWLAGCVSMHLDSSMSFSLHLAFIAVIAIPKPQHQTRRQDRPSVKRTTHSATSQVRPSVGRTTHSATSQGQAQCSRNHTLLQQCDKNRPSVQGTTHSCSDVARTGPVFKEPHSPAAV